MAVVLKVGGSLAENSAELEALCVELAKIGLNHPFVIVPGGGRFADCVRYYYGKLGLKDGLAHKLAILGMDQYGLILADYIPDCYVVDSFVAAKKFLNKEGRVVVFLPSKELLENKNLEASWTVTSDSIAVFIAKNLGIERVILVTDVDGIFSDEPKVNSKCFFLDNVCLEDLLSKAKRSCVDSFLPKILLNSKIKCFVVNGKYPKRIEALLAGKDTVCTRIF